MKKEAFVSLLDTYLSFIRELEKLSEYLTGSKYLLDLSNIKPIDKFDRCVNTILLDYYNEDEVDYIFNKIFLSNDTEVTVQDLEDLWENIHCNDGE